MEARHHHQAGPPASPRPILQPCKVARSRRVVPLPARCRSSSASRTCSMTPTRPTPPRSRPTPSSSACTRSRVPVLPLSHRPRSRLCLVEGNVKGLPSRRPLSTLRCPEVARRARLAPLASSPSSETGPLTTVLVASSVQERQVGVREADPRPGQGCAPFSLSLSLAPTSLEADALPLAIRPQRTSPSRRPPRSLALFRRPFSVRSCFLSCVSSLGHRLALREWICRPRAACGP